MSSFIHQRTKEIFRNAWTDALPPPPLLRANQEVEANLKNTLAGLDTPPTDQQLAQSLDVLNGHVIGDNPNDPYTIGISERVIAGLYARITEEMLKQALEADKEALFWWDVERSSYNTTRFLIQTIPLRLQRLASTFVDSLRHRNIPITFGTLRLDSMRRLFPTTNRPSELLIALFPHLDNRHRFFSSSPLALTRDECRIKRKQLETLRDDRALRVGLLALASHDLEQTMSTTHSTAQLNHHITLLQMALTLDLQLADFKPSQTLDSTWLDELSESGQTHNRQVSDLRRPSRWVQIWPRFLLIPPVAYLLIKFAYGSRATIKEHGRDAWETTKAFWETWVLQPIQGIIATVRTRGDEGVRVISKDALRADMDSLERMAVALGKEKLGYTQQQLDILHDQVQKGDLTAVLRVYEEDIKSPIRSAVTGTLVRSLLIQVQKMKVDVDFALSGIDKLLRSQELTFGFVGVAPALAIVYLTFSWIADVWRGGRGHGRFGGKKERRRVWNTMRRIERLLISPPKSSPPSLHLKPLLQSYNALEVGRGSGVGLGLGLALPTKKPSNVRASIDDGSGGGGARANDVPSLTDANAAGDGDGSLGDSSLLSPLANGLLLLASTQLRAFAEARLKPSGSSGPGLDGFRDEFLDDVSDLEDGRLSCAQKRLVLERMWRSWGRVLGWDNLAEL